MGGREDAFFKGGGMDSRISLQEFGILAGEDRESGGLVGKTRG